jgi:transposase
VSRGRPTKFDEVIASTILAKVKEGASIGDAASAVGIGATTLKRWLNRGKRTGEGDKPYRDFRSGYMKARAEAIIALELCVHKAGKQDADMALKALERLKPEVWSTHRNEYKRLRQELDEIKAMIAGGKQSDG